MDWKNLDGFELSKIAGDLRRHDDDRVAAAAELQRRSDLDADDLLELDAWTMEVTETDAADDLPPIASQAYALAATPQGAGGLFARGNGTPSLIGALRLHRATGRLR